jgi:ketosteroid isomerase-like protein
MGDGNLARVRRAVDAFNRRDLDEFLTFIDPEIELSALIFELEGREPLHGYDGVREWWRTLLNVFPDYTFEVAELRDFGDTVVVHLHVYGHGAESDAPVDQSLWQVIRLRNGKAVWWRVFETEAETLAALGT